MKKKLRKEDTTLESGLLTLITTEFLDIHQEVASKILNIPLNQVTPETRRFMKIIIMNVITGNPLPESILDLFKKHFPKFMETLKESR